MSTLNLLFPVSTLYLLIGKEPRVVMHCIFKHVLRGKSDCKDGRVTDWVPAAPRASDQEHQRQLSVGKTSTLFSEAESLPSSTKPKCTRTLPKEDDIPQWHLLGGQERISNFSNWTLFSGVLELPK